MRFPGFEGDWYKKELSDFIDVITGIPLQSEDISEDKSGIPILRGINITEGFIRHSKEIDRYYPKDKTTKINKYLLEKGDLVIGMDGSKVGKNAALISQFDVGSILIQRVARVRALGNANTNYIFQKVFSKEFQNYVDVVNTSSGIPHISLQQIKDFKTGFPPDLSEQEKIAAFLTLIDERITTQNKIIEQLETLIKGLNEKLLMQEIRFKDENGADFPKWEKHGLGELLNYDQPTKYLVDSTEYDDSYDVPVLTAGKTFILGYSNETHGIFSENLPVIIFDDFTTALKFVNFPFKVKSSAMKILLPKKGVNIYYVFEAMKSIEYNIGGHERHWISKYSKIEISVPCSEEQTKIANFLLRVAEKIETEKGILRGYQHQKQFLLTSLFI